MKNDFDSLTYWKKLDKFKSELDKDPQMMEAFKRKPAEFLRSKDLDVEITLNEKGDTKLLSDYLEENNIDLSKDIVVPEIKPGDNVALVVLVVNAVIICNLVAGVNASVATNANAMANVNGLANVNSATNINAATEVNTRTSSSSSASSSGGGASASSSASSSAGSSASSSTNASSSSSSSSSTASDGGGASASSSASSSSSAGSSASSSASSSSSAGSSASSSTNASSSSSSSSSTASDGGGASADSSTSSDGHGHVVFPESNTTVSGNGFPASNVFGYTSSSSSGSSSSSSSSASSSSSSSIAATFTGMDVKGVVFASSAGQGVVTQSSSVTNVKGLGQTVRSDSSTSVTGTGHLARSSALVSAYGDGNEINTSVQSRVESNVAIGVEVSGDGFAIGSRASANVTGSGRPSKVSARASVSGDGNLINVRAASNVKGDGGLINIRAASNVRGDGDLINVRAASNVRGDGGLINIRAASNVRGDGDLINVRAASNVRGDGNPAIAAVMSSKGSGQELVRSVSAARIRAAAAGIEVPKATASVEISTVVGGDPQDPYPFVQGIQIPPSVQGDAEDGEDNENDDNGKNDDSDNDNDDGGNGGKLYHPLQYLSGDINITFDMTDEVYQVLKKELPLGKISFPRQQAFLKQAVTNPDTVLELHQRIPVQAISGIENNTFILEPSYDELVEYYFKGKRFRLHVTIVGKHVTINHLQVIEE